MASRPHHARGPGGGRPNTGTRDIHEVIGQRRDGAKVTVLDRAVETIRLGGSMTDAAARVGAPTATLYAWEKEGTRALTDISSGRRARSTLTKHERKCVEWTEAMLQAEADGKVYLLGLLEQISGGYEQTETIETFDRQGNLLTRRTVSKHSGPDAATIRWRLERRWPAEFGRRTAVEVSGPGGGPVMLDAHTPAIERLNAELDALAAQTQEADRLLEGHAGP